MWFQSCDFKVYSSNDYQSNSLILTLAFRDVTELPPFVWVHCVTPGTKGLSVWITTEVFSPSQCGIREPTRIIIRMDVRYLSVPSLAEFSCFRVGFHARIFYPLWRLLAVNISWKVYLTSNMRIAFPLLDPFIYTPHHRSIHFNKSRSFKSINIFADTVTCYIVKNSIYCPIYMVSHSYWHITRYSIWYVSCQGLSHDHVVCFLAMWFGLWSCGMIFQNNRKLQFGIFKGQKWLQI